LASNFARLPPTTWRPEAEHGPNALRTIAEQLLNAGFDADRELVPASRR